MLERISYVLPNSHNMNPSAQGLIKSIKVNIAEIPISPY